MSDRWFNMERPEFVASTLFSECDAISDELTERTNAMQLYAQLYGDSPYNMFGGSYSQAESASRRARLQLNLVKACVNTVLSKITKNTPKPVFLTENGSYTERKKAEARGQYVDGMLYKLGAKKDVDKAVFDSMVYGTGILGFYVDENTRELCLERIFPFDLLVSDDEGFDEKPRTIYRKYMVDRHQLAKRFPDCETEILTAPREEDRLAGFRRFQGDRILVVESIHLPSSTKGAGDGKRCIAIRNKVLYMEEYDRNVFPYCVIRWESSPIGWYGDGLVKNVMGLQLTINKMLRDIERGHATMGKSHWLVHNDATVPRGAIDNDVASIIRYTGAVPPQVYTPSVVPPEAYSFLWQIWQKGFEVAGVSQLSASAQKPAGLNSGRALREYNDIETERFAAFARSYEDLYIQMARQIVYFASKTKDTQVKAINKRGFDWVKWDSDGISDEDAVIQCFPISAFSSNPVSKREEVQDLYNAGFISNEDALDLLDFPDVEKYTNLQTAPRRLIQNILEKIVETGEYTPPEPLMPLDLAKRMALYKYLEAKEQNVEDDKLKLLQAFLLQCQDLQGMANQAAPPPGDAGAVGGAAPVPQAEEVAPGIGADVTPQVGPLTGGLQ